MMDVLQFVGCTGSPLPPGVGQVLADGDGFTRFGVVRGMRAVVAVSRAGRLVRVQDLGHAAAWGETEWYDGAVLGPARCEVCGGVWPCASARLARAAGAGGCVS